jgi:hypothetical protein
MLVTTLTATVAAVPHCHPEPPPRPPEPPPLHPPAPPERPGGGGGIPHPGGISPAAESLEQQSKDDDHVKDIVCFAYEQFYDPDSGTVNVPTEDQFVADVLDEVLPSAPPDVAREKAADVYALLDDLQSGDLGAVAADVGCL